jgi:nucleotide-binding universal stress UspA family protein
MHIFFATDGSFSARFAQAQILSLPWRPPVHVTAMTALEVPHPASPSLISAACRTYEAALGILHRQEEARVTKVLAKTQRNMEGHVDSISTRMHAGNAGATIVDMARECRADLIAVGSRGLGPYKGFLLGSVSSFVTHYAGCPVLVTKSAPGQARRFLLALDGSPRDGRVLGWLKELDLSASARIHLVNIFPHPVILPGKDGESREGTEEWIPPDEFASRGDSPEVLEALGCLPLPKGVVRVTAEVRHGQEVPEILGAIKEFRPQLLILGAKGWHSPTWSTLGRVASKLIDQVPCSIIIVRP